MLESWNKGQAYLENFERDNYFEPLDVITNYYAYVNKIVSDKNRGHSPKKKSRLNIFKLGSHRCDDIFHCLEFIAQSSLPEYSQRFNAMLIVIYEKVFFKLSIGDISKVIIVKNAYTKRRFIFQFKNKKTKTNLMCSNGHTVPKIKTKTENNM